MTIEHRPPVPPLSNTGTHRALRETRKQLAGVFDALHEGVVVQDLNGTIISHNASAERILGLTGDQITGRSSLDPQWRALHEDGSPFLGENHPAMVTLRTGLPTLGVVMGVTRPDDSIAWININAEPVLDENGQLGGVVCGFTDVTLHRQAENEIRRSYQLLQSAQATAHVGGWEWDIAGNTLYWADETYRLFETSPAEYTPTVADIGRFFDATESSAIRDFIRTTVISGQPLETEINLVTHKGRKFCARTMCTPIIENGRTVKLSGAFQDITEHRQREEQLKATLASLHSTLESTADGILVVGLDGKIIQFNRRFVEMWRIPQDVLDTRSDEKALGFVLEQLTDPGAFIAKVDELMHDALAESFDLLHFKDKRIYERYSRPLVVENIPTGRVWSFRDVTARVDSERLHAALLKISEASHESSNLDDLYRRIHAIVSELMPARNFYIALLNVARDEISFDYWVDEIDPLPAPRSFRKGGGLTRWVLRHGAPLLISPMSARDGLLPDDLQLIGTDSLDWLGIPLKSGDKTIGMLAVQSYTGDVRYDEKHLELLQFVSDQVAAAIDRKWHDQALRKSEDMYRTLFDQGPVYITLIQLPEGRLVEVNDACLTAFGYDREDVIGKTTLDFGAWDDHDQRNQFFRLVNEHGLVSNFEAVMLRKDRTPVSVLFTSKRISIGENDFVLNMLQDITDRKLAEAKLRDNEEKFRRVFDQSPSVICLLDYPKGEFVEVNDAGVEVFGYARDEIIGRTSEEMKAWVNPEDRDRYLSTLLEYGVAKDFEAAFRRKNGEHFIVLINGSLITLGGLKYSLNSIRDITERKQAEALLRESEEQFKSAFENSALGIALVALDGRYLKVNASVCTFTGYDEQELLGMTFADITHPDDLDAERNLDRQLLAGEIENYRLKKRYFRKDGSVFWVQIAVSLVRDESGHPRHFISQIEDISATVQAQRSLEEANRSLAQTQQLLEASQYAARVGGWELDLGQNTLFWTNETYRIHDLAPADYQPRMDTVINFYTPESVQTLTAALQMAKDEGTPYDLELELISAQKRHVWVRTTGIATRVQNRTIKIGGAIQDITERKRAEQWQQHYSHVLAMITAETALPVVLEALAHFVEQQSESARCSILLLSPDGGHLIHGAAPSLPDFFIQAIDGMPIGEQGGACGAAALKGAPVLVEDIHADAGLVHWRELANRAGLRSCWSIPVFSAAHKVNGSFAIYHSEPWSPTPDDEELLRRSASLAALAIDRARHQEAQRLAKTVFEENVEGVMVTSPDAQILMVNPAFERLTGYSVEEAVGQAPSLLDSGRHDEAFWTAIRAQLARTGRWEGEVWHRRKNGEIYPVQMSIADVRGDDGAMTQRISIMTDVSQQLVQAARIEQLAFYDPLTGLPNRALFLDRLENILASSERRGDHGAILFMDLDRFKEINDSKGHAIGDLALAEVSRRFLTACRREETLARLGGDEFVLIAEGADHRSASLIASRLLQSLSEPLLLLGVAHPIGTSVGIAFYPADGTTSEELIKHTDIAMYRAKAAGGGYRFYQAEMSAELEKRLTIAQRLGAAMEANELLLYYQPKIELATGKLVGAEALLRWHDPDLGWISPAEFIPVAEQRGMMSKLGDWVLREGCRQLVEWRTRGMAMPGRLSINVSAQQIEDPEVLGRMLEIVHEAGAAPTWLELELTESSMMSDPEHSVVIMEYLAAAGFGLSIDDFGTGYSSLSYLKRFSADEIKIDISFVRDMLTDPDDYAIVNTIIAMAHGFGMTTTAEGVEVEGQSEALKAMGCDVAQGYLYSRAEAPDIFSEIWLAAGRMHAPASSTPPGGATAIP